MFYGDKEITTHYVSDDGLLVNVVYADGAVEQMTSEDWELATEKPNVTLAGRVFSDLAPKLPMPPSDNEIIELS